MSIVRLETSMSLDGYTTAARVRPEETMGDGGQVLHEWAFGDDERGRAVLADSQAASAPASPAAAPTTCPSRGGGRTAPAGTCEPRPSSCRTAGRRTYPTAECTCS
jgi:hypothetical protein